MAVRDAPAACPDALLATVPSCRVGLPTMSESPRPDSEREVLARAGLGLLLCADAAALSLRVTGQCAPVGPERQNVRTGECAAAVPSLLLRAARSPYVVTGSSSLNRFEITSLYDIPLAPRSRPSFSSSSKTRLSPASRRLLGYSVTDNGPACYEYSERLQPVT